MILTSMSLAPAAPVRSPDTEEATQEVTEEVTQEVTQEVTEEVTEADEVVSPDVPWVTIVWNDPVNLMTYVTWVFETYFGYLRPKAEKLMMDVHTKGRAVVSNGPRESMERDAESLQGYGLWATFEKDE